MEYVFLMLALPQHFCNLYPLLKTIFVHKNQNEVQSFSMLQLKFQQSFPLTLHVYVPNNESIIFLAISFKSPVNYCFVLLYTYFIAQFCVHQRNGKYNLIKCRTAINSKLFGLGKEHGWSCEQSATCSRKQGSQKKVGFESKHFPSSYFCCTMSCQHHHSSSIAVISNFNIVNVLKLFYLNTQCPLTAGHLHKY